MFSFPQSDKTALIFSEGTLTYSELNKKIEYCRSCIRGFDDTIHVLTSAQSEHFIVSLLACLMERKTVAVLSSNLNPEEKAKRLSILGSYLTLDESYRMEIYGAQTIRVHHPQARLILFTTGSLGEVKGVQLSEENILANCQAVRDSLGFHEVSSQLLFLPLSYSFSLMGHLLPGLQAGLSTTIAKQFLEVKTFLENGHVPQMWSGVPSHWQVLLELLPLCGDAKKNITKIVTAGAAMPLKLRQELRKALPSATVYHNYGLTEASPRVLCLPSTSPHFLTNATGYPIQGWQIKTNALGELLVKGKQVMLGYLGNQESGIEDGWLNTRDIAEIGPDNLVTILARTHQILKIRGEKVSIALLEQTLSQCALVPNAAVVAKEDALYGYRLFAFLESSGGDKNQIVQAAQEALYPKIYPIDFHIVPALPRKENGKVDRQTLERWLEAQKEYVSS